MSEPSPILTADLDCLGCGYNLRTRPRDSQCPECGKDVAWSLPVFADGPAIAEAVGIVRNAFIVSVAGSDITLAICAVSLLMPDGGAGAEFAILAAYLLSGLVFLAMSTNGLRHLSACTPAAEPQFGRSIANLVRGGKLVCGATIVGMVAIVPGVILGVFIGEIAALMFSMRLQDLCSKLAVSTRAADLARSIQRTRAVFIAGILVAMFGMTVRLILMESPLAPIAVWIILVASACGPVASLAAFHRQAFLVDRLRRVFLRKADAPAAIG